MGKERKPFFHIAASWVLANDSRHTVAAASAYIRRQRQCDVTGRSTVHDAESYMARLDDHERAKLEVAGSDFFCRGGHSREAVWQEIDKAARTKTGEYSRRGGHLPRLAIFIDAALPYGMTEETKLEAGRKLAAQFVETYGCAVEIAFHKKPPSSAIDHVHLLVTTREVSATGVGKMIRQFNGIHSKKTGAGVKVGDTMLAGHAEWMRSTWAELLRDATARAYDHRSYARQGLEIKPVPYVRRAQIEAERRQGRELWRHERKSVIKRREPKTALIYSSPQKLAPSSGVMALVVLGVSGPGAVRSHNQNEMQTPPLSVAIPDTNTIGPRRAAGRFAEDDVEPRVTQQSPPKSSILSLALAIARTSKSPSKATKTKLTVNTTLGPAPSQYRSSIASLISIGFLSQQADGSSSKKIDIAGNRAISRTGDGIADVAEMVGRQWNIAHARGLEEFAARLEREAAAVRTRPTHLPVVVKAGASRETLSSRIADAMINALEGQTNIKRLDRNFLVSLATSVVLSGKTDTPQTPQMDAPEASAISSAAVETKVVPLELNAGWNFVISEVGHLPSAYLPKPRRHADLVSSEMHDHQR